MLRHRADTNLATRRRRAAGAIACLGAFCLALTFGPAAWSQTALPAGSDSTWRFAVSGDSRNCGDGVMPAIAAGARAHDAEFFWHLGDFRFVYVIDEDFLDLHPGASMAEYQNLAWSDFIVNQLYPFGDLKVFLAIGNHELDPPGRTRVEYVPAFRKWLTWPEIAREPKPASASADEVFTYYQWKQKGVAFITLDSASNDQFSVRQLQWFEKVLELDEQDPGIRTIVVGMHKALPGSLSGDHSMNESPSVGVPSGRRVYRDLLNAQNEFHEKVYVLASHSHYYMNNVFNTDYWKGNVLPGWIVGTAGAQRYELPPDAKLAHDAVQGVYGYLLATVNPGKEEGDAADGSIRFEFKTVERGDLPESVRKKFSRKLIDYCFDENKRKPN